MARRGFPLTTDIVQRNAGQIMRAAGLKDACPSLRWAQEFVRRNNLSLRLPSVQHRGKCTALSLEKVEQHFQLLEQLYLDAGITTSDQVYNIDETGWSKTHQFR